MRSPFTLGRLSSHVVIALMLVAGAIVAIAPSAAAEETHPIIFPVVGENTYSDTWGAPRSGGRTHEGTDILADKMVPVVAADSGTVYWAHDEQGGDCCAMGLAHDDGWVTYYIHLNNDTPGTDDGQGWGFAPGLGVGVHVEAGQLIGYVGDSGNAEATVSHLHFELHRPDGVKINPYPSLIIAEVLTEPWQPPDDAHAGDFVAGSGDDVLHSSGDGWSVLTSTGSSFTTTSTNLVDDGNGLVGDFDGDGDDDVASFIDGAWIVSQSNSGEFASSTWAQYSTWTGWSRQLVGDFDGDGRDDIANFHPSNGTWWISRSTGVSFETTLWNRYGTPSGWYHAVADIDGDGATDVAAYHASNGTWWISLAGEGSLTTSLWTTYGTTEGWDHHFADFDGDGKADVASFYSLNGTWWVSTSTGTAFVQGKWADFPTIESWLHQMIGDFNGDGMADLAGMTARGAPWTVSVSTGDGFSSSDWNQ